ncbi:hypothetical protein GQ457_10G025220 [Hibiscus cannabinus]
MDSQQIGSSNDEEAVVLQAMHLASISALPFTLKVAVDLGLLEIISKADTPSGKLSAAQIVSQLPTNNPDAASTVDRILQLLATHSILTCEQITGEDGQSQRSYGLAPVGKYFLQDEEINFAPLQRVYLEKTHNRMLVTMEGEFSCKKAFGKHIFELLATDDDMSKTFNRAMSVYTDLFMNRVHSSRLTKVATKKKNTIRFMMDEAGNKIDSFEGMSKAFISFFTNQIGSADEEFAWATVGGDFTNAMRFYVTSSSLLLAFNATDVTPVPKVLNACKPKEFRPISC